MRNTKLREAAAATLDRVCLHQLHFYFADWISNHRRIFQSLRNFFYFLKKKRSIGFSCFDRRMCLSLLNLSGFLYFKTTIATSFEWRVSRSSSDSIISFSIQHSRPHQSLSSGILALKQAMRPLVFVLSIGWMMVPILMMLHQTLLPSLRKRRTIGKCSLSPRNVKSLTSLEGEGGQWGQ